MNIDWSLVSNTWVWKRTPKGVKNYRNYTEKEKRKQISIMAITTKVNVIIIAISNKS